MRLAFRMIAGKPGMSALAIVALALGIGLTTIMFSIVNGVLLRGLPFEESDRIYALARVNVAANASDDGEAVTLHDYVDWAARQRSFEGLAAYRRATANVVGRDGTPARYSGCWITANTFHLLRARPVLGRDLRDEDSRPGADPVAVIGDTVWQERFDRDPNAIGQSLRINGVPTTVVGVMPPKFGFPETQELWVAATIDAPAATRASSTRVGVIGRLPESTSLDQARAEMTTIARQLEREYPDTNTGMSVVIKTYLDEFIGDRPRSVLTAMMVSVIGVLIIACANVANLVLARAAERTREVAIRTALGASRGRVMRQMLIEVLVLAVAGAALGLGLSWAGVDFFSRSIAGTGPPFWIDVRIDGMVLLFVTAVTVLATVASGLVPAVRASRTDLGAVMNDQGRTTSLRLGRLTRGLVVVEMAVSFGLLVVSALVIQSIVNVTHVDYGFDVTHLWGGRVSLGQTEYPTGDRERQFADAALTRLRAMPGVEAVALSESMPPNGPRYPIKLPGQSFATEREYPRARGLTVSPDFFKVLRVGVEGRPFDDRDHADAPAVAIVSRPFATKFFPTGALGQQFALVRGEHQEWRTIVGITPDLSAGEDVVPETFFLAFAQVPLNGFAIAVRTAGPPLEITSAVREAVRSVDPNLPVWSVRSVEQSIYEQGWATRVFGSLFTVFGFAALFLATVGLYGVMAFSVSRRTQEVGVRMAMGAHHRDVLLMVLRQGLLQVGLGIVIGAGVGAGLGSLMSVLLVDVSPFDVRVFVVVAIVLTLTALAACLVPARRAAGLDPMVALRRQ